MATRGRKPTPTAIKELEGNPGKRKLNDKEPKPEKKAPSCPKWLEPEAKKEWRRLAKKMELMGVLTEVDISLPPEDSQFLSTRQFGVNEICRIFRVPPHMVQDLEHATFSNIEHQSIDFVVHTLTPWLVRFEQAIIKDLLLPDEQDEYFPKFNVDGLLRGDYQSRMQGYATGISNGFLSPNDIHRLENMDLIPAEKGGDDYYLNGGYVKLEDAGKAVKTTESTPDKKALDLGFCDEILYEAKKEEPDKEEEGDTAEPDEKGPVLEAQLYSTRQMGLNILNRLRENAPAAKEPPETKPPAPVIGLDGKTEDGAIPYQILKKQLEFLK